MTSDWSSVTVEELLEVPLRNGLNRPTAVRGEGTKMVNMGELFAHPRIRDVPMERVPLSEAEAETYLLEPGDLLFARQSLVLEGAGKCSVFLGHQEPVTYEGHIIRARLRKDLADPLFYYYLFASHVGRNAIASIVEQVSAAGIRGSDLARLKVPCPELGEQRTISGILGSLDDKVELNRRMNETLEAMAQAIFKSWFVDFDPVKAKAEGRQLVGMDAATAALFPDSFEESELGEIPKGWRGAPLSETIELKGGGTPRTDVPDFWNGDIPWISARDVTAAGSVYITTTERSITQSGVDNSSTRVLPQDTTVVTARGTVGACAMTGSEMAMNQTCYSVRGKSGFGPLYTFFSLRQQIDTLRQQTHGTIFDTITRSTFSGVPIVVPPGSARDAFETVVRPMADLILANRQQSATLAAIRDALLPKLMSGEVRVRDGAVCHR